MHEHERHRYPKLYAEPHHLSHITASDSGIDGDVRCEPDYWTTESKVQLLGKGTTQTLSSHDHLALTDFWAMNHEPYSHLLQLYRKDCKSASKRISDEHFRTWTPTNGSLLSEGQQAMRHSIDKTIVRYKRVKVNGVTFYCQPRQQKEFHPSSGISFPYLKKRADDTTLPIDSAITVYGIIQDIFLHQPWPASDEHAKRLNLPLPTIIVKVHWLIPVVKDKRCLHYQYLPIVQHVSGHTWNTKHPFQPIKTAYRSSIIFVDAPSEADKPGKRYYALDLQGQVPPDQYPH